MGLSSSARRGEYALDQNPFEVVQQLSGSYFVSRALHIAAELGVADELGAQPTRVHSWWRHLAG
jgi:hypothetical protein